MSPEALRALADGFDTIKTKGGDNGLFQMIPVAGEGQDADQLLEDGKLGAYDTKEIREVVGKGIVEAMEELCSGLGEVRRIEIVLLYSST